MAHILVVDDERSMREFLEILLTQKGHDVTLAENGKRAMEQLADNQYDLVITDLKMPGGPGGMEVLSEAKRVSPDTQVIVITAFSTTETAIQAMKSGAYDYIGKPFNVKEAAVLIDKALEKRELVLSNQRLTREVRKQFAFENIIGTSDRMKEVFTTIERIADTKTNLLISGESGTGKELVAKAVHFNSSRSSRPLVVINCGAIPDNLMESELFGHVKGSFTGAIADKKGLFEAAEGGTLFLDEIGELSLQMQVKLLRTLQERKVKRVGGVKEIDIDVRILAATNRNLEDEVRQGNFRDDLYFRVNVIQIVLPPLRERRADVPLLARHFLDKYNDEFGKRISGFTKETLRLLEQYDYPGNIRELENVIQRGVAFEQGEYITPSSLPKRVQGEGHQNEMADSETHASLEDILKGEFNLDDYLDNVEQRIMVEVMKQTRGNVTEAAKKLGISFRAMRYKLSKYGVRKSEFN